MVGGNKLRISSSNGGEVEVNKEEKSEIKLPLMAGLSEKQALESNFKKSTALDLLIMRIEV
jgi:hypothetical protein